MPTFHRFAIACLLLAVPGVISNAALEAQTLNSAPSSTLLALAKSEAGLASAYRVRLESAWPSLAPARPGCADPGTESLEGTLTRVGASRYEGRFHRTSCLRFCGVHGAVPNSQCTGGLDGQGLVAVVAEVEGDPARRVMLLEWRPLPERVHAEARGNCPARFLESLKRMYRSTPHAIEFDLPMPAAGFSRVVLKDYGWVLEIE